MAAEKNFCVNQPFFSDYSLVEVDDGLHAVHRVHVDTIENAALGVVSTSTYQETCEVDKGQQRNIQLHMHLNWVVL